MTHRVVVTGVGVVCALGNTAQDFADALRAGRSGVRLFQADPAGPPVAAGCPALDEGLLDLSGTERALFDPVTRYAMSAAKEALDQSGLLADPGLCEKTAVFIGTAMGGAHSTEEAHRDVWYHGTPPKPLTVLCAMSNAPAAHLSIRFGLKGPNLTYSVACASSALAIGDAFAAIRDGRVRRALVGGAGGMRDACGAALLAVHADSRFRRHPGAARRMQTVCSRSIWTGPRRRRSDARVGDPRRGP